MSITVEQLRRARPAALREVATGLERDRNVWMSVLAKVLGARAAVTRWSGPAAVAAAAVDAVIVSRIREVCVSLAATAAGLGRAAQDLQSAQELMTRAERLSRDAGGWLDRAGQLVLPTRTTTEPIQQAVQAREDERLAWEVTSLVVRAVDTATAADRDLERSLRQAVVANACVAGPASGPLIPPPPPLPTDPGAPDEDVFASAAWWRVLSSEERRTVITTHPEWVGNRDGIPARDRHAANLLLLARAQAHIAAEPEVVQALDLARRAGRGDSAEAVRSIGMDAPAIRRYLDLRAIREVVARPGPPRQLLALAPSGRETRAAVAIGNVDTADHVVTLVAGFSTTVRDDLGRYDVVMQHLRGRTAQVARGSGLKAASTAHVVWMGYEAPQLNEVADPKGRSVLSDRVAKVGAGALARFVNGIDVSRDDPPHQVVEAHSYGTVVLAHTLRRNTGVDDVVLMGSPGVGVGFTSLAEAGLKRGSLNVMAGESDYIAHSGWFATKPTEIPGALVLSTDWSYVPDLPLGTGTASPGHSDYFKAGTTSEENLAAVTLRRPDLLIFDGERRKSGGR